jgi:hypothetical protein
VRNFGKLLATHANPIASPLTIRRAARSLRHSPEPNRRTVILEPTRRSGILEELIGMGERMPFRSACADRVVPQTDAKLRTS